MAIHIFPNISQSKGNQTMKFGQSIDYNKRNIFLQSYAENEAGRLVPDLFLFFKKAQYEVKASGLQLSFVILRKSSTCHTIKINCIKLQIIDPEICSILIFQKRIWD